VSKYAGVWTPDMGADDEQPEERRASSASSRSVFSAQFDWWRRDQEEKARLAAWMNGRAPVAHWEVYGDWHVLVVQFPSTHHTTVYAAELHNEYGRVSVWCEGCDNDACGACRWAVEMYKTHVRRQRSLFADDDDGRLPF